MRFSGKIPLLVATVRLFGCLKVASSAITSFHPEKTGQKFLITKQKFPDIHPKPKGTVQTAKIFCPAHRAGKQAIRTCILYLWHMFCSFAEQTHKS